MIPIKQTIFGANPDNPGNCMQACVASILERPLDTVPNFVADVSDEWFQHMSEWLLREADMYVVCIAHNPDLTTHGYTMLLGQTRRGHPHSIVAYNGEPIHDPHPDNIFLDEIEYTVMFVSPMRGMGE